MVFQLCQNHYKENVRRSLDLTNNPEYQPFIRDVEVLFSVKRSEDDFNRVGKNIFNKYKDNRLFLSILLDIDKRKDILLGYLKFKGLPVTTNLIESFNSHFEGRLKPLKGFEDYKHADYFINALIIRRRLKSFTDCKGKFSYLNGKSSLEKSKKPNVDLPTLYSLVGDQIWTVARNGSERECECDCN